MKGRKTSSKRRALTSEPNILLFTKTTHECKRAQEFILAHFQNVEIMEGARGDPFPDGDAYSPNYLRRDWEGDYIISFLSPWIIPSWLLKRAKKAAINFHPGSPEYPGCGYNFALYDNDVEYGVTCHRMAEVADSGKIIAVERFPILPTDTVLSLQQRTMCHLLQLFYKIVLLIRNDRELPESGEKWTRPLYKLDDLRELCKITPDMDKDEVERRVRATYYPNAKDSPYLELHDYKFVFKKGDQP